MNKAEFREYFREMHLPVEGELSSTEEQTLGYLTDDKIELIKEFDLKDTSFDSKICATYYHLYYFDNNMIVASDLELKTLYFYHNNRRHRDNDKPAIESYNNNIYFAWHQNGSLYRENNKHTEYANYGTWTKYTWSNKNYDHHNENGSAIIIINNKKEYKYSYYLHDKNHSKRDYLLVML